MLEFRIDVKKDDLNNVLAELISTSIEKHLDEYGALHLKIKFDKEELTIHVVPRIDINDMKLYLRIWGHTKSEGTIHKIEEITRSKASSRKMKPSLLIFASKILELYESGIKDKKRLLQKTSEELGLTCEEANKFISLLKDSASRRVAHEKIKKAYDIIK